MKTKSVLLLAIIVSQIDYKSETCPHFSFVRKHLCEYCVTEADALEFSMPRKGQTGRNSVLAGNSANLNFTVNQRGHCQNENLGTVFECNLEREFCKQRKNCVTYHDTGNGHLYYQNTNCSE